MDTFIVYNSAMMFLTNQKFVHTWMEFNMTMYKSVIEYNEDVLCTLMTELMTRDTTKVSVLL
jgi:hypothetical protein